MNTFEVITHRVDDVRFGETTRISNGIMVVSKPELLQLVLGNGPTLDARFHVVRPGEDVRINGVLDVMEPRSKEPGSSESTFPGIGSDSMSTGSGRTHAVAGFTVMAVGRLPDGEETFVQEDCLVDMAGPAAPYSPFSKEIQLVVEFPDATGGDIRDSVAARQLATVRIARFLAARAAETDSRDRKLVVEPYPGDTSRGALRVAYVCSLISEGPLHDTLLYGESTEHLQPRWISVPEVVDGALVSTDFHYSCQRTPTVLYQRNPVVDAIRRRAELSLDGIVLTLRYGSHAAKRQAAARIAEMLVEREVEAIVTHPAVGGNAHIDALDVVQECEKAGIATALILQEMAGDDGADSGLVDSTPEANLMISTGNRDQIVEPPEVTDTLGPDRLRDGTRTTGPLKLSLRSYLCSTGQIGAHTMTAAGT